MIFMPFYINEGAARVTHFSSTLIFNIDQLTMNYFFTSFYLMMTLQNNPLVPTRVFFAQSTPGMQGVTLCIQYFGYPLCCMAVR